LAKPLLIITHGSSFINVYLWLIIKLFHCQLQCFFLDHVLVLVLSCTDLYCHPNMIFMFIVHWSLLWWCCTHCNCSNPLNLVFFVLVHLKLRTMVFCAMIVVAILARSWCL
jgi:hypothetical protein